MNPADKSVIQNPNRSLQVIEEEFVPYDDRVKNIKINYSIYIF